MPKMFKANGKRYSLKILFPDSTMQDYFPVIPLVIMPLIFLLLSLTIHKKVSGLFNWIASAKN